MKKEIVLLLLALIVFLVPACKKDPTKNTYSITGKMLKDCGGEPIANYKLRLRYYLVGAPLTSTKDELLGETTTDANGYFRIDNIPLNRRDNLVLDNTQYSVKWLDDYAINPIPKTDKEVVDLGVFYVSYDRIAKLDIKSNSVHNDTLYIGWHPQNYIWIFPIKDTILYYTATSGAYSLSPKSPEPFYLNWGVSKSSYDQNDFNSSTITAPTTICSEPPTTIVNIP